MAYCRDCGAEIGGARVCPECKVDQWTPPVLAPPVAAEYSLPAQDTLERAGARMGDKETNRRTVIEYLVVIALVVCAGFVAAGGPKELFGPIFNDFLGLFGADTHKVIYRVEGTAGAVSLTYGNASGGTEQRESVGLPWEEAFTVDDGEFLYVGAQNLNTSGSVKCTIKVDGMTVQTALSSGAFVIAACSGVAE